MSPARPGRLRIEHRSNGTRHTLALAGELDCVTAPRLEAHVMRLCASGASEVALELDSVSFIDSRGAMAMLLAKRRCEVCGASFAMRRARAQLGRPLELAGLMDRLAFAQRHASQPRRPLRRRRARAGMGSRPGGNRSAGRSGRAPASE
jgi:anti-anti-sigma factor